jgi:hypothetical protein
MRDARARGGYWSEKEKRQCYKKKTKRVSNPKRSISFFQSFFIISLTFSLSKTKNKNTNLSLSLNHAVEPSLSLPH